MSPVMSYNYQKNKTKHESVAVRCGRAEAPRSLQLVQRDERVEIRGEAREAYKVNAVFVLFAFKGDMTNVVLNWWSFRTHIYSTALKLIPPKEKC